MCVTRVPSKTKHRLFFRARKSTKMKALPKTLSVSRGCYPSAQWHDHGLGYISSCSAINLTYPFFEDYTRCYMPPN